MSEIIKVSDFYVGDTCYPSRAIPDDFCVNDFCYVEVEELPWDGTEYNPWDYKHENGEFILDTITIPEPTPEPTQAERIEAIEAVLLEMIGG